MTEHLEPTAEHLAYWRRDDQAAEPFVLLIGGPEEGPDVIPCPTAISVHNNPDDANLGERSVEYHIPIRLDEVELDHMATGGTLWFTTYGLIPIHRVEVQPPPGPAPGLPDPEGP